jgi:uncharacterized protein VirK/YbjX
MKADSLEEFEIYLLLNLCCFLIQVWCLYSQLAILQLDEAYSKVYHFNFIYHFDYSN